MNILLGFDPGGTGKGSGEFGWCVAEHQRELPLRIRRTGRAKHAEQAVTDALREVAPSDLVIAAGIDAPLFWSPVGDREADKMIRAEFKAMGVCSSSVLSVNSLQGACLIQGIMAAILLRTRFPELLLSESHPKAFLLMAHHAFCSAQPIEAKLCELTDWLGRNHKDVTEHERDAALATVSAWAMYECRQDWTDLYSLEKQPLSPIESPLGYWMPMLLA